MAAASLLTLINTFSGGSNGTTVAPGNSGGASGAPWDTAVAPAGTTLAYDATLAAHYGENYSCKVATTTSAACYLGWSSSLLPGTVTSQAQVWFRVWLWFTGNPASATTVFLATGTGGTCASVRVNPSGTISALDATGTVRATTAGTVPAGQWLRLEGTVTGDPAAGSVTVAFYPASGADPYAHDSTILAAANTATASGVNTSGPMTGWRFGQGVAAAGVGPYWIAGPGLSNGGYLGPVSYGFSSIRADDGGCTTKVAQPPAGSTFPPGTLAVGGDVEGFFTTTNSGTNWQPANTGVVPTQWRKCADIQYSQSEGATLYACVGDTGSGGGFLVSQNGGRSWAMRSTQVQYAGNHSGNDLPGPADQSRSTGNLLAQVGTSDLMYTATYKGGVFRAKGTGGNHGANWVNIGLGGGTHFGRCCAVDPNNQDTVYVAMYGEGVYKATNASTGSPANWALMPGSPAFAEEIVILPSGNIYVVAGWGGPGRAGYARGGLWLFDGTAWAQFDPDGSFLVSSSYWMSIDGYTDTAGRDQIIVGCNQPFKPGTGSNAGTRNLAWVTVPASGAATFTDVSTNLANINRSYVPPDTGRTWWRASGGDVLGKAGMIQPRPLIDKTTLTGAGGVTLYCAGSSGFWISTGNTVGAAGPVAPKWTVACNGMALHVGHQVTLGPGTALAWGTSDWCHFQVSDGVGYSAATTLQGAPGGVAPPPPGQNVSEGYAAAYDPAPVGPGTLFLSTGAKYHNDDGQIWAAPAGSLSFTNISIGGTANPGTLGGQVAYGLYCGRLAAGTGAPFLLAFVQGGAGVGGVWRFTGFTIRSDGSVAGGTWNLTSSGALGTTGGAGNIPTGVAAPFAADPGNPGYIYLFDQATGVWRSSNYGASWTASPVFAAVNNDDRSGQVAVNPTAPNEVWVSWSGGLGKIPGAHIGAAPTLTALTGVATPGGICFAPDGTVYCLSLNVAAGGGLRTQLLASVNGGTTWFRADNGSVAAAASKPSNMVCAPTGCLYIANDANTVALGYPAQPVGTPAAAITMGVTVTGTGSDVTGPVKNAAAQVAMGVAVTANGAGSHVQAAAQVTMAASLTTSGGSQQYIVQQVPGRATFDYGLLSIELSTTAGNCLVVLAGWDLSTAPVTAPMPAVNVADSAGNPWIHVATSPATVTGARCAAFICPNAAAVSWLSVSATGFVSNLACTVLEVAGMPPGFALDAVASAGAASAPSLALKPGVTSDSGFAFTVVAAGALNDAPPVPAGWNALNSVTSAAIAPPPPGGGGGGWRKTPPIIPPLPAPVNPVQIFPFFQPVAAGVSLNTTFTFPAAAPVAGVSFCARSTVYPPPQPDPAFPALKVEAGFGYTPGDISKAPPAWTDITSRAISKDGDFFITAVLGHTYELAGPEAGTLAIGLDNHDGAFTPGGPNAYPGLALEIPVRVSAYWAGSWYPVAYGWAERFPQEWPDLPQWGLSKMTATDAISVMAAVTMLDAATADVLIDAPYVLMPAADQYLSFSNGLTAQGILGSYSISDAQGLPAQNVSRVNQAPGVYADGTGNVPGGTAPAIAQTGQATNLLGTAGTGFGTTAIGTTTAPSGPLSGPGIIRADPNMPSPLSPNGVTVSFWVIVPAQVAVPQLQPTLFTAYGPPTSYPSGRASLTVQAQNLTGAGTLLVTFADGSALTAPFSVSASAQRVTLCLTATAASVYVNGALSATAGLLPTQVTAWNAVTFGCPNYAYGAGSLAAGNFTMFGLAIHACQVPAQRIVSQYSTGISGQQNAGTAQRVAQILTWAGLGLARAGRVTWGGQGDGVLQGPAYNLGGQTAAAAVASAVAPAGTAAAMPGGELVYLSKWALLNQSPVAVLGDGPGQIPYLPGQAFGYDNTYLANTETVAQQYGPNTLFTATGADFTSQHQYFPRAGQSQTIATMSAQDAADQVNWGLAKYAQPSLRVTTLTIDAAANPQAAFPAVLMLRQGQVVTVTRGPVGGTPITQNCMVQKITHSIGGKAWTVTLELSPYSIEGSVLQLDTAGFDQVGSGALA